MLRAVGSSDATTGGGKSRKSGRGAGNAKGPNGGGGGGLVPMNTITAANLMFLAHAEGPNTFTNFYDSSAFDRLVNETRSFSSNATYTTAASKFGSSSASVGGAALSTKSLQVRTTPTGITGVGTGDMGIQAWVYPTTNASFQVIYDGREQGPFPKAPTVYADSSGIYYYTDSANRITGPALTLNTWSFVEWSRVSGVSRLFVNGLQVGSNYTDTINFSTSPNTSCRFGAFIDPSTACDVIYIDEARVFLAGGNTANYIIPTAAFPSLFTVTSTWNSADKAATVSLMNDDRVAYTSANFGAVRGATSRNSGVYQFECVNTSADQSVLVGIAQAGSSLAFYPGEVATSYGYYSDTGNKYNNNIAAAYGNTWTTFDIIGVVYDATAGTLTFYKNGVSQGTAYSGLSGAYYPCWGSGNNIAGIRTGLINTGQTPFAYPIGGATAWG